MIFVVIFYEIFCLQSVKLFENESMNEHITLIHTNLENFHFVRTSRQILNNTRSDFFFFVVLENNGALFGVSE